MFFLKFWTAFTSEFKPGYVVRQIGIVSGLIDSRDNCSSEGSDGFNYLKGFWRDEALISHSDLIDADSMAVINIINHRGSVIGFNNTFNQQLNGTGIKIYSLENQLHSAILRSVLYCLVVEL